MELPVIRMKETGKNINRLRIEKDMTVREVQEVFGFSTPQAIYKWIHGVSLPSIDNLIVLSALFGVSIEEIIVVEIPARQKCG